LMKSHTSKALIIDKDSSGYTPVHYAARAGYLQVCTIKYDFPEDKKTSAK